jgi:hypothetical protein
MSVYVNSEQKLITASSVASRTVRRLIHHRLQRVILSSPTVSARYPAVPEQCMVTMKYSSVIKKSSTGPGMRYRLILSAAVLALSLRFVDAAGSLVFPPYGHSYGIRKATPQHLFMFFGPRTFFDNPQGLAATRLDVWDDSTTEKDDDEVVVYGVNSGRDQIIYNTSMWSLGLYGKSGSGTNCFSHPLGVAADRHGRVVVADSGNNRVVQLFNPKSKLQWVRAYDGKNGEYAGLRGPSRVGLDEDGSVYVTDPGNRRIAVFDSGGKLLRLFPQCTKSPTALAVADGSAFWSYFRHERVVFYAEGGTKLVKAAFDGSIVAEAAMPQGYCASYGATDYYHHYWVTDTKRCCILKFDHNLSLLDIFGSCGTGDNQFDGPTGMTIYKRYGQVFVAERKGAQYYWVGSDLKNVSITTTGMTSGRYTLSVQATEYSYLQFFTAIGKDTTFYLQHTRIPPGPVMVPVAAGVKNLPQQTLTVKLEPTYSSYTYYSWFFPVKVR